MLKTPVKLFFSHFCFLVIIVQLVLVSLALFLMAVMSVSRSFLCWFSVIVSMRQRCLQLWQVVFFSLLLTHIVSQCHLWDARSHASSFVFLFSGSFVQILLYSTSRMVLRILRGGQPRYLSLWQSSSCRVLFRVISGFSEILFLNFFFPFHLSDRVSFQYPQLFVGFLFSERSDDSLIWYFDSFNHVLFATSHY